jgi:hypothetical protein
MDKVTEKNTIFSFAKVKKDFFKDLGNSLSNYLLIKETRWRLKQNMHGSPNPVLFARSLVMTLADVLRRR